MKRVALIALLASLGLASVRAQDQAAPRKEGRGVWREPRDAFFAALSSHAITQIKLQETERQLAAIKSSVAPLEARLAELKNGPERAAAQKEIHERYIVLRYGQHTVRHTELIGEEVRFRAAALEAAWVALPKMFAAAERMDQLLHRPEQAKELLDDCYRIMKDIDDLERTNAPVIPDDRVDLGPLGPNVPIHRIEGMRQTYEAEAASLEALVKDLQPRVVRNQAERKDLMKLVEKGVMLAAQVKDNLASIDRRLDELTRLKDAAEARALRLRAEADRLKQREDELKREPFKGSGH